MFKIFTFLFFILTFSGHGQLLQTQRYEFEKKNDDDYFTVLSAGDKGVIILRDTDEYNKGDVWQIIALDTLLKDKWDIQVTLDAKYIFKGYELTDNHLYLLYRESEHEKSDYLLLDVNINEGKSQRYDIENQLELTLSHLEVVNGQLLLAGYISGNPTMVAYRPGDSGFTVIPGFFKDQSDMVDLSVNTNGTFNTVTREQNYEGYYLLFKTYSADGVMLFDREISLEEDIKPLSAKCSDFIDGNIVIAGTYGSKNSNVENGIFFVVVKPSGQKNIVKYYNFAEFTHFFDYMNPNRAERIRDRLKRKEDKGKDASFSSSVLIHDVIKSGRNYLVSADIYDPQYETQPASPYAGMYSTRSDWTRQMFSQRYARQPNSLTRGENAKSFEYLEGLVIKFNKAGTVVWDGSLIIDDIERLSLDPIVQVAEFNQNLYMLYSNKEGIHYGIYGLENDPVYDKVPLRLNHIEDEIKYTYESVGRTRYWYKNTFYTWGYHKVSSPGMPKRNVLYINKLTFE